MSDVHVKCGKALYSVPWKLIGQLVDIRATATMVQVFHHGQLVKTPRPQGQGPGTDVADYPPVLWNQICQVCPAMMDRLPPMVELVASSGRGPGSPPRLQSVSNPRFPRASARQAPQIIGGRPVRLI
jgi:hypothetical protein